MSQEDTQDDVEDLLLSTSEVKIQYKITPYLSGFNKNNINIGSSVVVRLLLAKKTREFYEKGFSEKTKGGLPICFSKPIKNSDVMVPHASIINPQSKIKDEILKCDLCPKYILNNTIDKQNSCKDRIQLYMLLIDDKFRDVYRLNLPPTHMVSYTNYIREVTEKFGKDFRYIKTKISIKPTNGSNFTLEYSTDNINDTLALDENIKRKFIDMINTKVTYANKLHSTLYSSIIDE